MVTRQQIHEIPGALRMTLEKAHADYGAVVRKVRWGDGPIYVCGAGDCADLGIAAGYAFETFPGWPVVARPVRALQITAPRLLRPRSVLILMAGAGEWPEAVELAEMVHQRDCLVVLLAPTPDSPLVKVADHVLLTHVAGEADSPAQAVCMHAALNFLAFESARLLKRPEPHGAALAEEFDQLPDKLEWVFTQLPEVVRSVAEEVARLPGLRIVGGGFYHYPALHTARRMRSSTSPQVGYVEASEFLSAPAHFARRGDTLLFLSGSQSRIKKLLHRGAAQARSNGARVLSLTDSNDRDLVDGSDLSMLVPALHEAPSSTLALFMLEWLAMEAAKP
jgi:DNA-binding MurR/RpiR family transcriptional regulator